MLRSASVATMASRAANAITWLSCPGKARRFLGVLTPRRPLAQLPLDKTLPDIDMVEPSCNENGVRCIECQMMREHAPS